MEGSARSELSRQLDVVVVSDSTDLHLIVECLLTIFKVAISERF